jgi:WD40 repeat protein
LLHRCRGGIRLCAGLLTHVSSDPTAAHRHLIYQSSGAEGSSSIEEPSIEVWDAETGGFIRELDCHGLSVGCMVAYDIPMDARECIAAGCSDGTLKLWDAVSGEQIQAVEAHTGPISALHVYYDPVDGRPRLVSAGRDAVTHVWGGRAKKRLQTLEAYKNPIVSLSSCVAADGARTRVVALDDAGKIWVYDPESGELVCTVEGHGAMYGLTCLSLSSHPVIFAAGMRGDGLFDAENGGPLWRGSPENRGLESHAVFQEPVGGRLCIAAGGHDGTTEVYAAETGGQIERLTDAECCPVSSLTTYETADGRVVLVVVCDRKIQFWDVSDMSGFWLIRTIVHVQNVQFYYARVFATVDGHYWLVASDANGELFIHDTLDEVPARGCALRPENKQGTCLTKRMRAPTRGCSLVALYEHLAASMHDGCERYSYYSRGQGHIRLRRIRACSFVAGDDEQHGWLLRRPLCCRAVACCSLSQNYKCWQSQK